MPKTQNTYAIRLTVDGGGKVKAELMDVGRTGDKSLKKIETASGKASRGLSTLAGRAKTLKSGIGILSGVLAGVALAGFTRSLVMQADAYKVLQTRIKTATKATGDYEAVSRALMALSNANGAALESTVGLFQSLARSAPELGATNKQILDLVDVVQKLGVIGGASTSAMKAGLLQFSQGLSAGVFRAEEFNSLLENIPEVAVRIAKGMGVTVGQLRQMVLQGRVLSNDVFEALVKQAPEIAREFADIPLSIDRATVQLDNAFSELLGTLDRVTGTSSIVAETLSGVAWSIRAASDGMNILYDVLTDKRPIDQNINTLKWGIEGLSEAIADLNRQIAENDVGFLDGLFGSDIDDLKARRAEFEKILKELQAALDQKSRMGKAENNAPNAGIDLKAAEARAKGIARIETRLQKQLFALTYEGAAKIRAEYERLAKDVTALLAPDGSNQAQVDTLLGQAAAVRDAKLAQLAAKEQEAANRITEANRKIIEGLRAEHDALAMTDRARFVSQALRRLSAEATDAERAQVRELAGALFDEQQATLARNKAEQEAIKLKEKGRALTESLRTAEEAYKAEIADLNRLLNEGAITQETFARASEDAYDRMLRASRDWSAGVIRALRDYADEASNAAKQFEQVTTRSLKAGEDAFVQWATTGKVSAADLFNTIAEEALRAAYRMAVIKPFSGFLENVFGAIGSSLFSGGGAIQDAGGGPVQIAHSGGVIGIDHLAVRSVDPVVFGSAPRLHGGGIVGGEVPIIAKRGETVFTPGQMRALGAGLGQKPEVKVTVNVDNRAPGTEAMVQTHRDGNGNLGLDIVVEKVEGRLARNIGRGEGLAPTLERRYGLNPAAGAYR